MPKEIELVFSMTRNFWWPGCPTCYPTNSQRSTTFCYVGFQICPQQGGPLWRWVLDCDSSQLLLCHFWPVLQLLSTCYCSKSWRSTCSPP